MSRTTDMKDAYGDPRHLGSNFGESLYGNGEEQHKESKMASGPQIIGLSPEVSGLVYEGDSEAAMLFLRDIDGKGRRNMAHQASVSLAGIVEKMRKGTQENHDLAERLENLRKAINREFLGEHR